MSEQKLYTTSDVAQILGRNKDHVNCCNYQFLHMQPAARDKYNKFYWNESQLEVFRRFFENCSKHRTKITDEEIAYFKSALPKEQQTDVNNDHPLVTDARFLNINFFPSLEEITPICFQEGRF